MKIILDEKQIANTCKDIGEKLTKRLQNCDKLPVFVGVLKGSLNFMMDLIREVKMDILTDYIQISSYSGTASSGSITLSKDLSGHYEGRTIVIVEDIVDTGLSMSFLINHIKETQHPKEVLVVSLFDNNHARKIDVKVDYAGCTITEPTFLMGYGLDYNNIGRNVPYVYGAEKDDIKKLETIYQNDIK